jgi:hypothetical protein
MQYPIWVIGIESVSRRASKRPSERTAVIDGGRHLDRDGERKIVTQSIARGRFCKRQFYRTLV